MPVILGVDGVWWLLGGLGVLGTYEFSKSAGQSVGKSLSTPLLIGGALIAASFMVKS